MSHTICGSQPHGAAATPARGAPYRSGHRAREGYFITHRRGTEPGEACTERPATVETVERSYFVAKDGYGDVHLWSGHEDDDDCQPLIARRTLDREHPALWPALLRGLGAELANESREG